MNRQYKTKVEVNKIYFDKKTFSRLGLADLLNVNTKYIISSKFGLNWLRADKIIDQKGKSNRKDYFVCSVEEAF